MLAPFVEPIIKRLDRESSRNRRSTSPRRRASGRARRGHRSTSKLTRRRRARNVEAGRSYPLASAAIGLLLVALLGKPLVADEPARALSLSWEHDRLSIRGNHLRANRSNFGILRPFVALARRDSTGNRRSFPTPRLLSNPALTAATSSFNRDSAMESRSITNSCRPRRGRLPFDRDQPNRRPFSGALRPTVHPRRQVCGRKAGGCFPESYLPRCFVYVDGKPPRLPTTPWAKAAPVHSRSGLVPGRCQPRRCQSAAAQFDRAVERADRGAFRPTAKSSWRPHGSLIKNCFKV